MSFRKSGRDVYSMKRARAASTAGVPGWTETLPWTERLSNRPVRIAGDYVPAERQICELMVMYIRETPHAAALRQNASCDHWERHNEAARARGIRVKLTLEHFRTIGSGTQEWADKSLHRVANGGTANSIAEFFDGERSRALLYSLFGNAGGTPRVLNQSLRG
jgi:hypothetical protein